MRCLNCGNKAKKDCLYYRCRSCCRGHGFLCRTHVKSTWVPISTRQLVVQNPTADVEPPRHDYHQQEDQQQLVLSSSSGFGGNFPREVCGEATFTRVQVAITSEENAYINHQYAYETTISIRGHVFRGVLYDQGPQQPMMNTSELNNPKPSSSSTPP